MYREETPLVELRSRVRCTWVHRRSLAGPRAHATIVPDACTDIVWTGSELRVAGPDTRPMVETLTGGGPFVAGLRFHSGTGGSVLGLSPAELCDTRIDLRVLWGDAAARLTDGLSGRSEAEALALLQRAVLSRRHLWLPLDPLVPALLDALHRQRSDPDLRMTRVARELGLSERQLQRRCVAAVGYAPKLLARILRMQRFREALRRAPEATLSTLAYELGFADQAHLSHESARLFGSSPSQLRKQAQRDGMSDFDKTPAAEARQTARHDRAQTQARAAR